MFPVSDKYKLILASGSARRQALLKSAGLNFTVLLKQHAEIYPKTLRHKDIAVYLSREKAKPFKEGLADNEIVITADTIVWLHNKVLGKPHDRNDAISTLKELSGNTHEVITGITLLSKQKETSFYDTTEVTFDIIKDEDIEYYVDTCKPYDKAGAYGIQEWIGLTQCSSVKGSFYNIMGLPVNKLMKELSAFLEY